MKCDSEHLSTKQDLFECRQAASVGNGATRTGPVVNQSALRGESTGGGSSSQGQPGAGSLAAVDRRNVPPCDQPSCHSYITSRRGFGVLPFLPGHWHSPRRCEQGPAQPGGNILCLHLGFCRASEDARCHQQITGDQYRQMKEEQKAGTATGGKMMIIILLLLNDTFGSGAGR